MHVCESTSVTREQIRRVLVEEFSVADHVAHDIATYRKPEFVWQQIEYARYEVGQGMVHSAPAYVVARIRDGWGPPAGYTKKKKRWYSDEEYELYFVHPESYDEEEE